MTPPIEPIAPLRRFVIELTRLADTAPATLAEATGSLLSELVARDDWLPDAFAQPHPEYYQQFLLHCDPLERFSIVSFVWGPGQRTPIHDHGVWGWIGMLRGAEKARHYGFDEHRNFGPLDDFVTLNPGEVDFVSPETQDIHLVENALPEQVSISIHIYGANIGAVRRRVFDTSGVARPFVSGYSGSVVPNLWDRSHAVRAGS